MDKNNEAIVRKVYFGLTLLCIAVLAGIHIYHVVKGPTKDGYQIAVNNQERGR